MTNRDVIIACDFSSAEETFRFLDLFKNEARKPFLKKGLKSCVRSSAGGTGFSSI